jgi:hypothetical protein
VLHVAQPFRAALRAGEAGLKPCATGRGSVDTSESRVY